MDGPPFTIGSHSIMFARTEYNIVYIVQIKCTGVTHMGQ